MLRAVSVLALCVGLLPGAFASAQTDKPIVNSIGMKFVPIPAGAFTMGSPADEKGRGADETPREVKIAQPFELGVHEVTQAQYERVMGKNPSFFAPTGGGKQRLGSKTTEDHPVENVSWNDAVAFCDKLGKLPEEKGARYRLPTEAEWEYACRAGTKTPFHYGSDLDSYKANFNGLIYAAYGKAGAGPFLRATARVGDYQPNAWGLYDMHGNVQEWCSDAYDGGTERVLRGGGWPNSGKALRSAVRNKLAPDTAHYSAGFRVVREAK